MNTNSKSLLWDARSSLILGSPDEATLVTGADYRCYHWENTTDPATGAVVLDISWHWDPGEPPGEC